MICDNIMKPIVAKTQHGNILLEADETEQSVINSYFSEPKHINYVIDDDINGYLCVSEQEDSVFVCFAWHVGTFTTQKKMVKLGKELYKIYTLDRGLPMYYSGQKNFYSNHCEYMGDNVWKFIP